MAFKLTKLEKVLAAAVGLDIARPGTSRAAFTRAAQAAVATIPRVAPPVARGAVGVSRAALGGAATLARRNPAAATGRQGIWEFFFATLPLNALRRLYGSLMPLWQPLGVLVPSEFRPA